MVTAVRVGSTSLCFLARCVCVWGGADGRRGSGQYIAAPPETTQGQLPSLPPGQETQQGLLLLSPSSGPETQHGLPPSEGVHDWDALQAAVNEAASNFKSPNAKVGAEGRTQPLGPRSRAVV